MKDTKQHILDTAFKLFLQRTFKEVTMKEIVDATELSKGAFYHYFSSKEELFREVINKFNLSQKQIDFEKFDHSSLKAFYTDYLNVLTNKLNKDININRFTLIFEALKLFPEIKDEFSKLNGIELNAWLNIIAIAKNTGEIKSEMSDENIAQIFLSTVKMFLMGRAMELGHSNKNTIVKNVTELWDSFYNQLKP